MCDWHKNHPEESIQFRTAMDGVTQYRYKPRAFLGRYPILIDNNFEKPSTRGTHFFTTGLSINNTRDRISVVDVEGRDTAFLAHRFPALSFQTQVE